ncbi:hypothetical protein KM043_014080 [Ampulex compressa]|nr:hypothetical protein KM043_014080 [Ampulex compressa]
MKYSKIPRKTCKHFGCYVVYINLQITVGYDNKYYIYDSWRSGLSLPLPADFALTPCKITLRYIMSTNKSVTVLLPNGHRQNVKVTPNTTILEVLSEACHKHGYNVNDYDAKHFNRVLDSNAIFRFTGLPNNAQLEMIPCTKARTLSVVVIGIQLESGERLTGEFSCDATLSNVLERVCPSENLETAVLIYMHREMHGINSFGQITLKSLGLTSGKAMLRLIHRTEQQLKTQAHVSAPLIARQLKAVESNDKNDNHQGASSSMSCLNNTLGPSTSSTPERFDNNFDSERIERLECDKFQTVKVKDCSQENDVPVGSQSNRIPLAFKESDAVKNETTDLCLNSKNDNGQKIEFLGDRDALVFNQAEVQAIPKDELPDNFFDLTVEDAKVLLRDAKRRREELEEAPLLTDALRKQNQDKQISEYLIKYRHTVIRIQFPDQFVLQGLFGALEPVQTIKDFLKEYLNDPQSEFTIYTTPPKHILDTNARLIDENLVPSAVVYYSGSSTLKEVIKTKLVDPVTASVQAARARMSQMTSEKPNIDEQTIAGKEKDVANSTLEPKHVGAVPKDLNKVPKWFKP